jgi:uncharacterized integral membrane protein (TIGR00698 family)
LTLLPTIALLLGAALGLTFTHPFPRTAKALSQMLLQVSIVLLGFDMDLERVLSAGRSGFVYTLVGIAFALGLGTVLGRALRVSRTVAYLVSVGTAICGGSAIVAVGPVVSASDEEMSVSIGTVFLLNAVGLVIFPPIGHLVGLTEPEFGLWAALAIHDTSSVVGAGARFGAVALTVATTVKLARALWIVPLVLVTAAVRTARARTEAGSTAAKKPQIRWPWFIAFFVLAAAVRTYVPALSGVYPWLSKGGRLGLAATLFLIGTGMSRASLRKVGARPLILGVALWIVVATCSLGAIALLRP